MIAPFNPETIQVLVFDVDDTVTRGTLGIKTKVWDELFSDKLSELQEARELYEYTGKGDRYNMIAHVVGESQEGCRENEKVIEWAEKFESMTMVRIRENGIHENDVQALVDLRRNFSGPIYLLSATPQEVVEGNIDYFEEKYPEIKGVFAGVIGTPMDGGKAGGLANLAQLNGVETYEVLMVGDGGSDYSGAKEAGTQFIGVIPDGKADKWPGEEFPKIDSINKLPSLINLRK